MCQLSNYMVTDYNKEKQINCTIMRIVHLSFHCVELAARRGWVAVVKLIKIKYKNLYIYIYIYIILDKILKNKMILCFD
jgi:hypothetical protein